MPRRKPNGRSRSIHKAPLRRQRDEGQIGVRENQHCVFAGKLHHGGRVAARQPRENVASIFPRSR